LRPIFNDGEYFVLAIVRISREYLFRFQYGFEDAPLFAESAGELFRNFEIDR
jgi:hypothetical protein